MKLLILTTVVSLLAATSVFAKDTKTDRKPNSEEITIRTETYARPPQSGATYYIYERGEGKVICTKLKVENKYDDADISYYEGSFKHREDFEYGTNLTDSTKPVVIPADKLDKHTCLTKFFIVYKK